MTEEVIVGLYSGTCCKLPLLNGYVQHVIFSAFVKETYQNILLCVTNFLPSCLFLLTRQFNDSEPIHPDHPHHENFLGHVKQQFNDNNKVQIAHFKIELRVPSVGFTNSRRDFLLRVYFEHEGMRKKVADAVLEYDFGCFFEVCKNSKVIHSKVKALLEYMHEKQTRYHTWQKITCNLHTIQLPSHVASVPVYQVSALHNQLQDATHITEPVTLRCLYFWVVANSSYSTKTMQSAAQANVFDDHITHLIYKIDDAAPQCLLLIDFLQNTLENASPVDRIKAEAQMLNYFHHILLTSNTQIVVFVCDEFLNPLSPMEFVFQRVNVCNQQQGSTCSFSWSPISGLPCEIFTYQNDETDLNHHCTERLNVTKRLQKTHMKPELTGYSLLHALRHPKALKNPQKYQKLLNLNYVTPNKLTCDDHGIMEDRKMIIELMYDVVSELGIVANVQAVSKLTDLNFKYVVERGEQKRIFNAIMREFNCRELNNQKEEMKKGEQKTEEKGEEKKKPKQHNLYFNEEKLKDINVQVARTPSESSFPDPPWIANPDMQKHMAQPIKGTKQQMQLPGKAAHQAKPFQSPVKKAKSTASAGYGGGLVLPPMAGFWKWIVTLDWNSMYPNIIITWLLCMMALVYEEALLQDPKAKFMYVPERDNFCNVFITEYDGQPVETYLPQLESSFLAAREVERKLKTNAPKGSLEAFQHAMAEIGCKQTANAVYGFFGSKTSGMTCLAVAAAVTRIGQHMQQTVREKALLKGAAAIGGDTDSGFFKFIIDAMCKTDADIIKCITDQATSVATTCSAKFHPCKIIVENVFPVFWAFEKKKTYIARKKNGEIVMKGIGVIRRDRCDAAKKITQVVIDRIANENNFTLSEYKEWLLSQLIESVPWGPISSEQDLAPFVVTAELGTDYKNDNTISQILARIIEVEMGFKPSTHDRLSYVMAFYDDSTLSVNERVLPPSVFLKKQADSLLDVEWYLKNQAFGCLKQILCLPCHAALLNISEQCVNLVVSRWQHQRNKQRRVALSMKASS